ncbi:DUF2529 family protein [Salirhabdus sp. Marseille-P4669]|uniref:DUF2529 family protein n=1 Tax=Salirhabdus sp. Marseille-P4669 TaxID=2042310 RepID=UPI000C7B2632|nr:DUF2529 family protein [Salirhabdus sp. Marseille-P4669]
MLQAFTTHVINHFHQIKNEEGQQIEDAARILCNTIIGDGHIYWYGTKEMQAFITEVVEGAEPIPKSKYYQDDVELSILDRLIIVTPFADNKEVIDVVKKAQDQGTDVIVMSAVKSETDALVELADFHIDTKLVEPLLEIGDEKIGFPSVLMMFYVYYCLYVNVKEILDDFDSPLPTFE